MGKQQGKQPTKKDLIDAVLEEGYNESPNDRRRFEARFIPSKGWHAVYKSPKKTEKHERYFLGDVFESAIAAAKNVYGLNTWGNQPKKS